MENKGDSKLLEIGGGLFILYELEPKRLVEVKPLSDSKELHHVACLVCDWFICFQRRYACLAYWRDPATGRTAFRSKRT